MMIRREVQGGLSRQTYRHEYTGVPIMGFLLIHHLQQPVLLSQKQRPADLSRNYQSHQYQTVYWDLKKSSSNDNFICSKFNLRLPIIHQNYKFHHLS